MHYRDVEGRPGKPTESIRFDSRRHSGANSEWVERHMGHDFQEQCDTVPSAELFLLRASAHDLHARQPAAVADSVQG